MKLEKIHDSRKFFAPADWSRSRRLDYLKVFCFFRIVNAIVNATNENKKKNRWNNCSSRNGWSGSYEDDKNWNIEPNCRDESCGTSHNRKLEHASSRDAGRKKGLKKERNIFERKVFLPSEKKRTNENHAFSLSGFFFSSCKPENGGFV